MRQGLPAPALERRPEIPEAHESAWEAFAALNAARSTRLGPEPIPISEIEAFARLTGLDAPDEREELVLLVQAIDRAYLEWLAHRKALEASRGSVRAREQRSATPAKHR